MMGKKTEKDAHNELASSGISLPIKSDTSRASTSSELSDGDLGLPTCRVCQCVESDKRGDAMLSFLGITPTTPEPYFTEKQPDHETKITPRDLKGSTSMDTDHKREPEYTQFVSPSGEVFVCNMDLEIGVSHNKDTLIELGCSCKNELALVHYACALKWFVNHGSTTCEICGRVAAKIRSTDFRKVLASLKEYEALRDRTANGEPNTPEVCQTSGVDPDAIAAIHRQRLSEIYLWFNPHGQNHNCHNNDRNSVGAPVTVSGAEQPSNIVLEEISTPENPTVRWAVEGTGILLATGLLTVTLARLVVPRVSKKTAKHGLHILLGGVCALAVVVFCRFVLLTRIRYGPARYWALLFVFWFLLFGIWASRTHAAHPP